MDKQFILFDLDGTLTDPKIGITRCVQYALNAQGIEAPDLDELECYIGPPLDESFQRFHKLSPENAQRAVEKYRERFRETGIFENDVIDGIEFCLGTLKAAGKTLALATCKPEEFAVRILEHFGLSKYFDAAVGSLDGIRKYKSEVIEEVFTRLRSTCGIENAADYELYEMKAASIMVGDRREDIDGAHEAGIEAVGVRFGYARENELEDAGADYIADSVEQLTALLLS